MQEISLCLWVSIGEWEDIHWVAVKIKTLGLQESNAHTKSPSNCFVLSVFNGLL